MDIKREKCKFKILIFLTAKIQAEVTAIFN